MSECLLPGRQNGLCQLGAWSSSPATPQKQGGLQETGSGIHFTVSLSKNSLNCFSNCTSLGPRPISDRCSSESLAHLGPRQPVQLVKRAHLGSPLLASPTLQQKRSWGPTLPRAKLPPTHSPSTSSVAIAVVKLRVPGIVARQTYTPECWTFTSEIMRFPFPSTRVLKTSMDLWSVLRGTFQPSASVCGASHPGLPRPLYNLCEVESQAFIQMSDLWRNASRPLTPPIAKALIHSPGLFPAKTACYSHFGCCASGYTRIAQPADLAMSRSI